VKYPLRTLSIIVALGLLVAAIAAGPAFFGARPVEAATVTIAENEVEFAKADGSEATSAKPNSTARIFIRDDALETTKSGKAVFSVTAAGTMHFDIATGMTGTTSANATTTRVLTAVGYASTSPSTTPLTDRADITATVAGGSTPFVTAATTIAGTFSVISGVATTTTVDFKYHVQDVWTGTDSALRRAKVISTSDPAGEWVTVSEVATATNTSTSATSRLVYGTVFLSSDAATQGTGSDGVWVQDGDTLTVQYMNSAGTVLDSDTVSIDGVKPTIAAVVPADGTITNVANPTVTFDVTDAGSGISTSNFSTDITLTINGNTVSPLSISFQAIAGGFRGIFAQGTSWLETTALQGFAVADSTEFSLAITATDQAGNSQTVSGTSANVTIDKVAPTLGVATTGSANTSVVVNFTDTTGLDSASVNTDGSDFTVAGTSVTAAAVDATNKKVTLTVSALASDAKPEVKVTGSITDKAGNAVVVNSKVTATDGVKAVISAIVVDKDLAIKADKVTTTLATDEKMAVDWPKVTVFGPAGASSNGALTVTSPTPNNFSAAATVAALDTTGIYGVSIQGRDLGNNNTENLTEVVDELLAAASVNFTTDILTLANGPIADRSFNGVLNGDTKAGTSPNFVITTNDVSVTVNGTSTGVTIGVVDASARTVTITAPNLVAADVIKVSYSYATDNFEVDQSAPAVTFDPDGTTDVQNQSPFIRLIFDEDEYPGDSFKTVTLTKASLTDPAGTVTDVLASFATGDNIEFIWAASDLALGKYTLKVSATDTAGNALTDSSGTFTIAKRTITLSIRPGWNLVSLPDSPAAATNDVNDVFNSDKIDVVLSFDAIRNNWFSASRQSDGTLGRPGSGLAITSVSTGKGYWVHSTAIVSLKVDVPGLLPGAAAQPPSFALTRGWNLVSYTTSDLTDVQQDADDYFTGLDWSRAFGYDNASNKFVSVLPSVAVSENLDIGKAYWIFLNKAGTLVPP